MITRKEHFEKYFKTSGYSNQQDILDWALAYSQEVAIKADREELAILVDKRLENESEIRAFLIDGSSIINAPQIELL